MQRITSLIIIALIVLTLSASIVVAQDIGSLYVTPSAMGAFCGNGC